MRIRKEQAHCKFCGREKESGRAHLANPFCSDCFDERLEASDAIDLRDNYRIIDEGNGYSRIVPIDETKLWRAR